MTTQTPPAVAGRGLPPAPTPPGSGQVQPASVATGLPTSPADLVAATLGAAQRGTPGRMRLWAAVLVVVGLLVSLAGGWTYLAVDGALTRADANAAQLVRLAELQTSLVRADADATNAFLVGGLEPPEQRADYDAAMATVTDRITRAAEAQPADGTVLAQLNTTVMAYANGVELARAANRQGLPVGSQYLRNASADLRADALPALAALIDANEARVAAEFRAAGNGWLLVVGVGLAGLLAVVLASRWLAGRTHRVLNPRLVSAGLVLALLTLVAGAHLGSVSAQVDDVADTYQAEATALTAARLAAFDAKSNESLTLIARGSGAAFEDAWVGSRDAVLDALRTAAATRVGTTDLEARWASYADAHAAIRALDDGGSWDQAVAAATSRDAGSANAAFTAFDQASESFLTAASESTSAALAAAGRGLTLRLWLAVAAGLLVAYLSWSGIARRIEEYR